MSATRFVGLPIVVNQYMPAAELWLVKQGNRREVHVHEGPQAGEDAEVWINRPRIIRLVNLGEMLALPKPKEEFELESVEP